MLGYSGANVFFSRMDSQTHPVAFSALCPGHLCPSLYRGDDAAGSAPPATWLTPVRALVMFSLINLLTYLDRGAFAACLDTIEKDLALSNVDGGFIGSCVSAFVSSFGFSLSGQCLQFAGIFLLLVLFLKGSCNRVFAFFLLTFELAHQAPTSSALSAPRSFSRTFRRNTNRFVSWRSHCSSGAPLSSARALAQRYALSVLSSQPLRPSITRWAPYHAFCPFQERRFNYIFAVLPKKAHRDLCFSPPYHVR